ERQPHNNARYDLHTGKPPDALYPRTLIMLADNATYLFPAFADSWYWSKRNVVLGNQEFGGSNMKRTLALLVACAFLIAAPLSAHHSTAMYTGSKTVTGKVL